jgi:phospholipid/cholesterol/gamma-HCH transport system ATP-binding protein
MSDLTNPAISFDKVSISFDQRPILQDVSFEVATGEALCLLGRSGTGKTVALKLMIGLAKPDKGAICIQGENIVAMNEDKLSTVRRQMGFLFQSGALFDSFSVNDNLQLPLERFTTKSKEEIDALIQKRLDEVGLGKDRYKMPADLSGGMKKRAGLARALVLEPCILLVDEPSSGLDRVTASEIDALLVEIKKTEKTTMVVVTHDASGARRVGDRMAVLDEGHLLAIGSAGELENHENALVRTLTSEKE